MTDHFALFDTAIGCCSIAWNARGIIGVHLPETGAAETRSRMQARFPGASEAPPPPSVASTIGQLVKLLDGQAADLSQAELDLTEVPPFHQRVYQATREIPAGSTRSYGEVAARLGSPGSARAVGQALGRNPFPIIVPCHRVLAAGGKLGGFTAPGGTSTKEKMLTIEAGSQ